MLENSKIPSKFPCVIPRLACSMSSSGLTRGSPYGILEFFVMRSSDQVGDDRKRKAGNFYRDCPGKPDNDTALEILEFLAEFSFIVLFCLLAQLLLAAVKSKGQREFRNSKIPRAEFKIPR